MGKRACDVISRVSELKDEAVSDVLTSSCFLILGVSLPCGIVCVVLQNDGGTSPARR